MISAQQLIDRLGLVAHPEGGYFRETWCAADTVAAAHLPARYGGSRCFGTAILFLIDRGAFSALHRIKSDELWHYHGGGPLEVVCIHPDGTLETHVLADLAHPGGAVQIIVPAGCWFGARLLADAPWCLVGCTVSPGFDFADFELGRRAELVAQFPRHRALIAALTQDN